MAAIPLPSCSAPHFPNHHSLNKSIRTTQPYPSYQNKNLNEQSQTQQLKESLEALHQKGSVDNDVYATLLQASASSKALAHGKQIHSILLKNGVKQNVSLETKLVNMYVNCKRLEDARQVFDRMPKQNLFVWNTLIRGYAAEGLFDVVLELYTQMQEVGMKPNRFTFPFVLKALASMCDVEKGKEVHECVRREGFEGDLFVGSALVAMYVKCGRLDCARQVFDRTPQRDVVSWNAMISGYAQSGDFGEALKLFREMGLGGMKPNVATLNAMIAGFVQHGYVEKALEVFYQIELVGKKPSLVTWNSVIGGCAQNGYGIEALDLFKQMQVVGIQPDAFTFASILPVFAESKVVQNGRQFHNYIIKSGLLSDVFVGNALLDMYCKCGRIEDAQRVFDRICQKDVVTWNAMIAGYTQSKHYDKTWELFIQMQLAGVKPDSFTVTSFLPACSHIASLPWGKEIHSFVVRNGFDSAIFVGNALVDMYFKCGSLKDAHFLFDRMTQKTVVSWNTIIAGYGMHGHGEEALRLLSQMRQEGMQPNDVTLIAILTACSHAGMVDEGWEQFDCMERFYQIKPRVEHYACIVDLLGRAGCLDQAYTVIEKMPIEPDVGVWGALLGACRIHRNVELAEHVAKHIFELDPQDSGYYVLMSNIYAAAGRWAEAVTVRRMMITKGVKKMPGCSWIDVKHKAYTFLTGDRSHPQSDKIYSTVESLIYQIKAAGYVPDTRFVLYDLEENEKQEMLYGHSEKLAIAFGLINTSPGTPIRITKNLRMCGDCHTAAKFISNIAGREIIVRDMYRFHHFKGGLCSCGDYW